MLDFFHDSRRGFVFWLAWNLFAVADLAAGADQADLPQREMLLFEEPLVTAAAKHPQSVQDAPSAVTVVTAEEIRRFGYRTLAEVLRSVRGFYGSYDRNYSYIGVRGFLRAGDYNDRLLLLVNGHSYNDDIYQTAYLGPEFGIDLEAIDRIEVIRGPGSALYGGNALFAVINVVTADGRSRPGVQPLIETGSFGRKRGQVSVGHVFENGVDLFAGGSVLDVDGQDELFYPEFNQPENNRGIAHDADAERALSFFTSVKYRDFVLQGGANTREKVIPTAAFGTTFNDSGTKTIDGRQFAELLYSSDLMEGLPVTARAYYDGVRYHGTYIFGTGEERVKNEDLAPSHWLGGEIRAEREIFSRNTLTLGSEYTYHPDATQENFNINGERFLDDHRSFGTWGIYGQDEWSIIEELTLIGGIRYDSAYYNRIREWSPRAALLWRPLSRTTAKLLFGQAFRPPNLFEQYYAGGATGYAKSVGLNPERITTYEVVGEQELWGGTRAVASVFHYRVRDLIDQATIVSEGPDNGFLQYQNLNSARATGGEVELRVPLPRRVSMRTSYSFQDVRASGGHRLSNSPKHLGNFAVLFPLPLGLEGGAEMLVIGPRRTLAERTIETAVIPNLTLIYAYPSPRLTFSGSVYNFFNQAYADPGGAEHQQDELQQDRLTFRVQLRYGF